MLIAAAGTVLIAAAGTVLIAAAGTVLPKLYFLSIKAKTLLSALAINISNYELPVLLLDS